MARRKCRAVRSSGPHRPSRSAAARVGLTLLISLCFLLSPALRVLASETQFLRGELISLSAAESFYGTATTHTSSFAGISGFEGRPPEIVEMSRALDGDIDRIFEFVHNHIEVEFAYGLRKGALGTLIDRSGTPLDQTVLFVELARQAGFTARYRIGTATLTPNEFADWTGLTNGVAACRMLAFGGIPASINGASPADCTVSPTITSVRIRHFWAQVRVNGVWYAFDPSFKTHAFTASRNLVSVSGFTSGAPATQAAGGLASGSQSGVAYIRDANDVNLDSYLAARSAQLLSDLEANAPAVDMRGVIGGRRIEAEYAPEGGFRNVNPPYTSGAVQTVTGDVPDQYRTHMAISATTEFGAFSRTLYVDDIYGRRLEFDSNFNSTEIGATKDYYSPELRLEVDDVVLNAASSTCTEALWPACISPGWRFDYTIAVNHPYAAQSGGYADETITGDLMGSLSVAILHGWGQVSSELAAKWGRERDEDTQLPGRVSTETYDCDPSYLCPLPGSTGDMSRQRLGASWLAQVSRMIELQGEIGGSEIAHHHSVGVVRWEYQFTTYYPDNYQPLPDFPPLYDFGIRDQQLVVDLHTSLSVASRSNDTPRERAVSRSVAMASATLEGSVVEQMQDLPDGASVASRFAWGNRPEEDPCNGGRRRFYNYTGAAAPTVQGLVLFEGSASGCSTNPNLDLGMRAQVRQSYSSALQAYIGQGFEVTGSAESFLGPGARYGAVSVPRACVGSVFSWEMCSGPLYLPSEQRGGAFIASSYTGSGDVVRIAHITMAGTHRAGGGGGASPPEINTTFNVNQAADVLRDRFIDRSSVHGVNLSTGDVGYTTPVLLSAGSGDSAPYRLDYSLSYKGGPSGCRELVDDCIGPPQSGWTSNWNIHFSLSGSGLEAMGETSPFAATDSILAFMALQDTFLQSGVSNLNKDVFAGLVADWWRRRLVGNVATVNRGFQAQQYVRRGDNGWVAPVGAPGVLTQNGQRVKQRYACRGEANASRNWSTAPVTFSLRNASGDVVSFAPWQDIRPAACISNTGFEVASWTWPQGVSLGFTTNYKGDVTAVQSSLGRTLDLEGLGASIGGRSAGFLTGNVLSDSAGEQWTYAFTADVARSATERPRPFQQLYRVFQPTDPGQPALQYTYDALGRVREARDAVALQGDRDPYVFFIADQARGRRLDPEDGSYTVDYDTDGNAVRFTDEMERQSLAEYDGRHRVTRRVYPGRNADIFGYDARDNVIRLDRCPTPPDPESDVCLGPLTIEATYDPTWNRLATVEDARGGVTSLTYYGSGPGAGLVATAVRPAVAGGAPTYSFTYNSIGLVTSETDPTGRVTTHGYNAAGDRTSTTVATAAVGGNPALNLTTGFTPNVWGDVITAIDPRGNATSVDYDAMRRPTEVRNHDGGTWAALLAAIKTTYDELGRLTETAGGTAFSGTTVTAWQMMESRTYTPTGQVETQSNGEGDTTTMAYDGMDRVLQVADPVGRITRNDYDEAGQLTHVIRAYGTDLPQDYARYTWTPNGQQASVRDANNNRSVTVYDGFDRPCRMYFPVATVGADAANTGGIAESELTCASGGTNPDYEGYGYDANGNRTALRLRSGETIGFTFDALDRQTAKDLPGGTTADVFTSYDLAGRRLSSRFVSTSGQGVVYAYDAAGRLLSEQSTIGTSRTVAFEYDAASNRTRLTWPDSQFVTYTYDRLNRMDLVNESGVTVLADYGYDPLGRRATVTRSDGTVTTFGYDLASRLTGLAHDMPGAANDQTYGFTFTAASQISQRTTSNPAYDWYGSNVSRAYSRNGLNQYTSVGGATVTHDARGNLTGDGSRTFSYDLENRLTSVSGSAAMTLSYDPLGRLRQTAAGSGSVQMLYDGDRMVAEYDSAGALLRRHVHGPGVDEPILSYEGATLSYPRHLITDNQGSIITSGSTRYAYGPYGEPDNWSGSRFRYTGQAALPEAQLYYYKARVYDPMLGRFLQTDPIGYQEDANLYAYVGNNPVNLIDPTGMQSHLPPGSGPTADQSRAIVRSTINYVREDPVGAGIMAFGAFVDILDSALSPGPDAILLAASINTTRAASAESRAIAIAGTMSPRTRNAVTIAVTETAEGVRVVTSSEGALRPAARAALEAGEVAGAGVRGTHAEVNGVNAAVQSGLTPTGTAASRPICPECAEVLQREGVALLSPLRAQ